MIQDLRGLSFKAMYSPGLAFLKKVTTMDADNYPEGTGREGEEKRGATAHYEERLENRIVFLVVIKT